MSYLGIREDVIESLKAYAEDGRPCGHFLTAVLSNDLFAAIGRADATNLQAIDEIVTYIYNEMPSTCWGSYERVKAWIQMKDAAREKAHEKTHP